VRKSGVVIRGGVQDMQWSCEVQYKLTTVAMHDLNIASKADKRHSLLPPSK
jgi:uncharacterized protein (UPF0128 family)